MSLGARSRSWLRARLHRSRTEQDMDRELRFHVESYTDDLIRSGLSEHEARRRAHVEFGSMETHKEECRAALGLRLLDELSADVRYAVRILRRSPGFSAVAILSLALGIGANTTILSMMEATLWKTVPVNKPEELRILTWVAGPASVQDSIWDGAPIRGARAAFSYAVFKAFQADKSVFQRVFAFKPIGRVTTVIDSQAELVAGELVSGNFFESVGIYTIAGRPIAPADDTRGGNSAVAVISDGFWARRFGRDPSAIGKQIEVNQVPLTIIGVNPPDFTGMEPGLHPDIFMPVSMQPVIIPNQVAKDGTLLDNPGFWWLPVMGRLKPGVTEAQALAAMDVVLQHAVQASLPGRDGRDMPRLRLIAGAKGLDVQGMGESFFKPLLALISLAGLVLLMACTNVANLLLARATARQREIGMRLALGAGPWRITRQMLTEGLVLAVLSGAAGLLLGFWMRNGIPNLLGNTWNPSPVQAKFDFMVVAISITMTLVTGVVFSLAPAWQAIHVKLNTALKGGGARLPGMFARKALVVLQVCLSLMLLVGAGLFTRTLSNLKSVSLGFKAERVLLFTLDPPATSYAGDRRKALFAQFAEQIGTIPGVQSAGFSSRSLLANRGVNMRKVHPLGRPTRPGDADLSWFNSVGGRFFETMGIPILYGRAIGPEDRANTLPVAVINQQFVNRFYPGRNPLGETFEDNRGRTFQIVGICGDARYGQLHTAVPATFYPALSQTDIPGDVTFALKTAASQAAVMRSVREVLQAIDRDLPLFDVRTQTEQIDATLSRERMFAALTSAFGLLAMVLASVGIYGVVAHAVARRTGEIGVRMALGAQNRQVLGMVLREATLLAGLGVAVGIPAAMGLTRYVRSMLWGVESHDPLTLCGAACFMLFVALIAGWWPARKASRLSPMAALRHE